MQPLSGTLHLHVASTTGDVYIYRVANMDPFTDSPTEAILELVEMIVTGDESLLRDCLRTSDAYVTANESDIVRVWNYQAQSQAADLKLLNELEDL